MTNIQNLDYLETLLREAQDTFKSAGVNKSVRDYGDDVFSKVFEIITQIKNSGVIGLSHYDIEKNLLGKTIDELRVGTKIRVTVEFQAGSNKITLIKIVRKYFKNPSTLGEWGLKDAKDYVEGNDDISAAMPPREALELIAFCSLCNYPYKMSIEE